MKRFTLMLIMILFAYLNLFGATIAGTVYLETIEQTIADVTLELYVLEGDDFNVYVSTTESGQNGQFTFDGLEYGMYNILVYYQDQIVDDITDIALSPATEPINGLEIIINPTILPQGNLHVDVEADPSVQNIYISIFDNNSQSYYEELVVQNEVTFSDISVGEYILTTGGFGLELYIYDGATSYEDATLIEVLEDETTNVTISLTGYEEQFYTISGNVSSSHGEVIGQATVLLIPLSNNGSSSWNYVDEYYQITNAAGDYSITVPEGEYELSVSARFFSPTFWPGTQNPLEAVPIDISSNLFNIDFEIFFVNDEGFTVSGEVNVIDDDSELPVYVIAVSSDEDDDDYIEVVTVRDDGSYDISLDESGEYFLLATTSGVFPVYYPDVYDWEDAQVLQVESDIEDINFTLNQPENQGIETVAGVVTNDDGSGVSGATVLLYDQNDIPVTFTTTNSNGEYSLTYLASNDYAFNVTKMYYQSYSEDINTGEQSSVDAVINMVNPTPVSETNTVVQPYLLSNYPNPFNPETTITYYVGSSGNVEVEVYNILGQKVKTLVQDDKSRGLHSVIWNGKDDNSNPVSSGIYLYKIKSGKYSKTKKMILMK